MSMYDAKGTAYLDLYGGAVISIGHSHPHMSRVYNNWTTSLSIPMPFKILATKLADAIGEHSCLHLQAFFVALGQKPLKMH